MRNARRKHREKPQPLRSTYREAMRQKFYIFHAAKAQGHPNSFASFCVKNADKEYRRGKPVPHNPEELEGIHHEKRDINLRERYTRSKSKR